MQKIMIYWQSVIPQHVSGVFTPIISRADCVPLPMVSCPGYSYCGSGNSLFTVHTSRYPTLQHHNKYNRTGNHRQCHAVCSPDDGRKDSRNMLRNNWLSINHYLLRLVALAFICYIRGIYIAFKNIQTFEL